MICDSGCNLRELGQRRQVSKDLDRDGVAWSRCNPLVPGDQWRLQSFSQRDVCTLCRVSCRA
jgi:hypothetical protein